MAKSNPIHAALVAILTLTLLATSCMADYVLYTGEVLLAGQNLTNGKYQLAMQGDCDLVLYDDGYPTWSASTAGHGGSCYLAVRHTGELVLRRDVHYTLWSSGGKSRRGKYALALDDKGKLGVYGPRRWTTNNNKEKGRYHRFGVTTQYVLFPGERLSAANRLVYKDFEMSLTRCNIAIKDHAGSGRVLWQSNTKAKSCILQMEADGELALRHGSNLLWSSDRRAENGMYIAVLRFDGRLAVYGPLVWSNDMIHDDDSLTPEAVDPSGGLERSMMHEII